MITLMSNLSDIKQTFQLALSTRLLITQNSFNNPKILYWNCQSEANKHSEGQNPNSLYKLS